jgi:hypothetical protein
MMRVGTYAKIVSLNDIRLAGSDTLVMEVTKRKRIQNKETQKPCRISAERDEAVSVTMGLSCALRCILPAEHVDRLLNRTDDRSQGFSQTSHISIKVNTCLP